MPFTLDKLRPRLGKTFIDRLTGEVILTLGNNTYSRDDLVRECKCGNFNAARRLNKVLDDIGVKSGQDLASLAPEDIARIKGVGETTIYVLLCLQDHMKIKLLEWGMTWTTYAHHQREDAKDAKKKGKKKAKKTRAPRPTNSTGNHTQLPLQ